MTNNIPSWNLSDLYKDIKDPAIEKDLYHVGALVSSFCEKYENKLTNLSASHLAEAIFTYEAISEKMGKLSSFASLLFSQDMTEETASVFYQNIKEKISDLSTPLLFFTLELNDISEKQLERHFQEDSDLHRYKPWIEQVRVFKKHQLSKDMEKLLHEKSIVSADNWVRLYDETFAHLRFVVDGQAYDTSEIINQLTDANEDKRRKAAKAFGAGLAENSKLFTLIMNTLIKDKEVDDKWRQYAQPISSRNQENFVEDEVVESLLGSVQEFFPHISHRYYEIKARWMGKKVLPYWDRNAPFPGEDERYIPWDEAKEIVLDSYRDFSPVMADIGQRFFDRQWIDGTLRSGKDTGAFSHPTVPSVHPYILQNYHGKMLDVMTLSHELGHGIHQVLAAEQGYLMSDTPLTLAETASIFGEILTFQKLLDHSKPAQRKILLAKKVGDMLNSIVRQVAFCLFEKEIHSARKTGELSPQQIGQIWMKIQKKSLGSSISFDDEYQHYWSYISHFFHTPFYVYAYAFGNCLVNSLYAVYQKGHKGFEEKYLNLLKAGGTLHHRDLVKPFGLDTAEKSFWNHGLNLVKEYIDQFDD